MNNIYRHHSARHTRHSATSRSVLLALLLIFIPTLSFAIDAPRDVRGTEIRVDTIKWEWRRVPGAEQYSVTVDGKNVGFTTDNRLYSRDLWAGDHSMTVKAIDSNGKYSARSATAKLRLGGGSSTSNSGQQQSNNSNNSSGGGLRSPGDVRGTVIRDGEIKWEWQAVDSAVRYDVVVNGNHVTLTQDTKYTSRNLGSGSHSMSVKAIDNKWRYSSKSRTIKVNMSGGSPGQSNNQSGLEPPRDVRGTEVRTAEIKWEWRRMPGASKYEVTVDGRYVGLTSNLYLYTANLGVGEHTMTVKSVSGDGRYSNSSATARLNVRKSNSPGQNPNDNSNNDSGKSLPAPRDPRGTEVRPAEVKWEWASVDGAVQYEVTVDGNSGLTPDTFLYTSELSRGEHRMSVKAISRDGKYSASSATAVRNISSGDSSPEPSPNSPSPAPPAPAPAADDNGLVDPASWSQPDVQVKLNDYRLTFSDEFNSDRINPNRWNTRLRWDGSWNGERYEYRVINGENQLYVNIFSEDKEHQDRVVSMHNPFEFDGSRLAIRAVRNPVSTRLQDSRGYGPLSRMIKRQDFLSGAITTFDKFTQKYGYFEARIKIPNATGTFPAFWLHHQRREWENTRRTEIDIMENLGHAPWYVYNSFHYYTGVSEGVSGTPVAIKPTPEGQIYTGTDYSQGYHVYAAEWKPGYIKYMIDGQKVSEVWNSNVDHEDLYVLLNLAVGGLWTNYPRNAGGTGRSNDNRFPTSNDINEWQNPALEIDYVRVYKRK